LPALQKLVTTPVRTVGGFAGGFRYPLLAAFYIVRHPSLWPWCVIPVVINVIVLGLIWWWTGNYSEQLLASYLPNGTGWYWDLLRKGAVVLVFVARAVITLVSFVVVGTFAALPFNDLLSEQTDKIAGGWRDDRPFSPARMGWELAVTGLQEGKRMTMYLVLIVPLFLLSFIPILAPFTLTLKVIITAFFFTTDYLSYPMERRGALLFRHKMMIARRFFFPSLGFGCAVTCLALIPVINFMFFPLAVVGGTLLFSDLVRQSGEQMRRGMPTRFNPYGPPGNPSIHDATPTAPPPPPTTRRS